MPDLQTKLDLAVHQGDLLACVERLLAEQRERTAQAIINRCAAGVHAAPCGACREAARIARETR